MRKRDKGILLLILSLILGGFSYKSAQSYLYTALGNRDFKDGNFSDAIGRYQKALSFSGNVNIKENILKSSYAAEDYETIIKEENAPAFEKGNALVKFGENLESPEQKKEQRENYEKALLEYKKALLGSEDINIKKNYEIVLNRLNEDKEQQDQDQQNDQDKEQNQDNQDNKDQNQQNQQNRDNQNNQGQNNQENSEKRDQQNSENNQENEDSSSQNQDNQDEKQNDQNEQQNEKNRDKKSEENNQDNQENQSNQDQKNPEGEKDKNDQNKNRNSSGSVDETSAEESTREQEELQYMLKKLEGNEKQAFKNNEQLINLQNSKNQNRW